jgi:aconitase A
VTVLLILSKNGATVFANACGPCIGMWDREGADKEERHYTLLIVTFLNVLLMEIKHIGFRRFT